MHHPKKIGLYAFRHFENNAVKTPSRWSAPSPYRMLIGLTRITHPCFYLISSYGVWSESSPIPSTLTSDINTLHMQAVVTYSYMHKRVYTFHCFTRCSACKRQVRVNSSVSREFRILCIKFGEIRNLATKPFKARKIGLGDITIVFRSFKQDPFPSELTRASPRYLSTGRNDSIVEAIWSRMSERWIVRKNDWDPRPSLQILTKHLASFAPRLLTQEHEHTWGVQVLSYPNFFLGNGSR